MIILSQTDGLDGYHGTVGTPTNMSDSYSEPLFVGDLVTIYYDGDSGHDKTVHFVCEEDHRYAMWTKRQHQYVMGIANTWNSDNFNKINLLIKNDEDFYEQIGNISNGWIVKKVKSFEDLVVGERWGFLCVREVDEIQVSSLKRG